MGVQCTQYTGERFSWLKPRVLREKKKKKKGKEKFVPRRTHFALRWVTEGKTF